MRFLAFIGALAIIARYRRGDLFLRRLLQCRADRQQSGDRRLGAGERKGRLGRRARHGARRRPISTTTETVKAGARIYATIGCVNCHGGPPDANWAKWSEGLKPVPADLKVMAKERTAGQLFWVIRNGIKFTGHAELRPGRRVG